MLELCNKCGLPVTQDEYTGAGPLCQCGEHPPPPAIMHGQPVNNGEVFAVTCRVPLDLTTEAGRAALLEAIEAQAESVEDNIDQELHVIGYIVHPAQTVDDQTGEAVSWQRTVVMLADGRCIASASEYVRRSLERCALVRGHAPWNPPLRCQIVQERSRNKRTYYRIKVVV